MPFSYHKPDTLAKSQEHNEGKEAQLRQKSESADRSKSRTKGKECHRVTRNWVIETVFEA